MPRGVVLSDVDQRPIRGLSASEREHLQGILRDFDAAAECNWSLVGSLSYRLFHPDIAIEPGLRDVDIAMVLEPGQNPETLLSESVLNDFHILHVAKQEHGGYYYQLRHKKSDITVDAFTRPHQSLDVQTFRWGDFLFNVQAGEETLLHGIEHLLMCNKTACPIAVKRVFNARLAWQRVDQQALLLLFEKRRQNLQKYLPENLKTKPARDIVTFALRLKPSFRGVARPTRRPSSITSHGLAAEAHCPIVPVHNSIFAANFMARLRKKYFGAKMRAYVLLTDRRLI